MKKNFKMKIVRTILMLGSMALLLSSCEKQTGSSFNHNQTLFPLTGSHVAAGCRECHKDGAITTLPTACFSCHPMSVAHTKNLGDCNLCHTTATFSAAYFNHHRVGAQIQGRHKLLIADNCNNCHTQQSYSGVDFSCGNCHSPPSIDGTVHTSTKADCSQCHSQFSFTPASYPAHNSYAIQLKGAHSTLLCSDCHPQAPNTYKVIDYRDGQTYGSCANCHTRDYDFGESDHRGIAADANCLQCHSYSVFDD